MEDDLLWKTISVEDNLRWKTTFGGLGGTVPHSDFLIDTKKIETQRILGVQNYMNCMYFPCILSSPLCDIFYVHKTLFLFPPKPQVKL